MPFRTQVGPLVDQCRWELGGDMPQSQSLGSNTLITWFLGSRQSICLSPFTLFTLLACWGHLKPLLGL